MSTRRFGSKSSSICAILSSVGSCKRRRPLAAGVLEEMYLGKTRRRLAGITEPPALRALVAHEGPIVLNGREVANLPGLWKSLEGEVERLADNGAGVRRARRSVLVEHPLRHAIENLQDD